MAHASEAQHWYRRDGTPAYTVKSRDGSDRPATLRDARKLGLLPSVTSIIRCASAPGLERWKLDQMLHAALTLPRAPEEPEATWIERVWTDSKETARKAAERGTAVHAAIQGSYEGKHPGPEYLQHTLAADNEITSWLNKPSDLEVAAETSFAHPFGFGGKVDLEGGPPWFIVDFKTKEFTHDTELKTWDEHAMQLAAYRVGLDRPQARCAIVYVSVTVPGLARLIEIPEDSLKKGWKMFYSLLMYWQAKTGYASSWIPGEKVAA